MTSTDDLNERYRQARAKLAAGRKASEEGLTEMRAVRRDVHQARSRGQINQQIWETERALGHHAAFFSQAGQDAWLDANVFRGKRGGTFVEIGGYDGITGSNCLFFELMRGWQGLLVEPAPSLFAQATAFRRARCLQIAVASEEGEAEFLEVQEGYRQMSGLTASYDADLRATVEADPRHKGALIQVQTLPLEKILEAEGLTEIDFISLDVEGGEMDVLTGFPFDKFAVTAWTVENNTSSTEIPALMQARGYKRVEALGVDDVYLRETA